jgi:PQQ-dependent catabolism-associated CXXCW motif protein
MAAKGELWLTAFMSHIFPLSDRTDPPVKGGYWKACACALALLWACTMGAGPSRADALDSAAAPIPDGYRQPPYKGLTPDHLPGAETVSVDQALALQQAGAVMIDVSPLSLGGYGAMAGQWVVKAEHETITGAIWLPNVGEATPAPWLEAWFQDQLARFSGGDKGADLVFFCRPDCWMSWNAGRRAVLSGYTGVHWLRDGIPGWRDALLPISLGVPQRVPAQAVEDRSAEE